MTQMFEIVSNQYRSPKDVPKASDIFYRCDTCDDVIPSIPDTNISCTCGKVVIDRDYWRLIVFDFSKFSVLRRLR